MKEERSVESTPPAGPKPRRPGRKRTGPRRRDPELKERSREARRQAAVILEVLAGVRSAPEGAEALGVSLTRYYAVELRALGGLVAACEPRPRGPRVSPESEIEKLQRALARLEQELARERALSRAARRSLGLVARSKESPAPGGPKRRRRRRAARALRLVARLQSPGEEKESGEGRPEKKGKGEP